MDGTLAAGVIQAEDGGSAIGDVTGDPNLSGFEGLIDEVALFDRALRAGEMQQVWRNKPNRARISIERSGSSVILTWLLGRLQCADDAAGPWNDLEEAVLPCAIVPTAGKAFYRLKTE